MTFGNGAQWDFRLVALTRRSPMKTIRTLLLIVVLGSAAAACGTGDGTASQATSTASPTAFVLQEWSITAPSAQIRAGNIVVTAINRGNETHELVIVRAADAASLPIKSDGSVDEDKISEAAKPGEIADIKAGTTISKTIELAPGNYIAVCNLVDTMGEGGGTGEGGGMGDSGMGGMGQGGMGAGQMGHVHYLLGMVVRFAVV
jgi:uncharacterized membrane protein YgcG